MTKPIRLALAALALTGLLGGCVAYPGYGYGYGYGPAAYPADGYVVVGGGGGWHGGGWHDGGWHDGGWHDRGWHDGGWRGGWHR